MTTQAKNKTIKQLCLALGFMSILCVLAPSTSAAAEPRFKVYASIPDTALPGEKVNISFTIQNVGDARSTGPITMSDTVSAGLAAPTFEEGFEEFIPTTEAPFE